MTKPQLTPIRLAADVLLDSPTNPRQFYDEDALQELADSILSQGLIQPIVARPIGKMLKHEIVCGHRRVRAARLAGLEVIDAIVKDMTDDEAATAQIHENLARRDVTPLEEAEGYDRLIRKFKVPIEKVIKDSGKSRAYIYGILSLRKLHKPGQEALAAGLPVDLAQRVASLPTEAIQRKVLDDLRSFDYVDGERKQVGWVSAREGKRILSDRSYFIPISGATFSLTATYGALAPCESCERRSINDPANTSTLDVCADVPCFQSKTIAARDERIQALRDQGHRVLEGADATAFKPTSWEDPRGYCPLELEVDICDELVEVTTLLEKRPDTIEPPQLTYIVNQRGVLDGYIKTADLNAIGRAIDASFEGEYDDSEEHDDDGLSGDGVELDRDGADEPTQRPNPLVASSRSTVVSGLTEEETAARDHWHDRIKLDIMRAAASAERTIDDLRVIAAHLIEYSDSTVMLTVAPFIGWGDEPESIRDDGAGSDVEAWALKQVASMPADTLALLILLIAIDAGPPGHGITLWQGRIDLAKQYGVPVVMPTAQEVTDAAQLQIEGTTSAPGGDEEGEEEPVPVAKPAAKGGKASPVRYRNPATGETWSGRGLQPKWLKAAIAAGNNLSDYATEAVTA